MLKKIFVSATKCSGCRYCEMVCSFRNEGSFNYEASRITIIKEDKLGLDYPIVCHQCDPCPCVEACPVQALEKTKLGVIEVSKDKCIKCGRCVDACLFGAVKLHPKKVLPIICDLCDGDPLCVKKCPTAAISFEGSNSKARRKGYEYSKQIYKPIFKKWGLNV